MGIRLTTPDRRPEIDGLRALAVMSVVFGHVVSAASGGTGAATRLVGLGNHGVDLFFVLSGFCLSYPLLLANRERGIAFPRVLPFLRRRIARIAPPFYAALALFGILGFTTFGYPVYPFALPSQGAILEQLGQDALFLTGIFPIHNSDFWTIGVEMRWYVLFPLILALYDRSRVLFAALWIACYLAYLSPAAPVEIGTLPCFMLGIVAADLTLRRLAWRPFVWILAVPLVVVAVLRLPASTITDHGNMLWHLVAFAIVLAVVGNAALARVFSLRPLVFVGVASYSIYLVHHPLFVAAVRGGLPIALAATFALACGIAFWRFVEAPALRPAVRKRIENALDVAGYVRPREISTSP